MYYKNNFIARHILKQTFEKKLKIYNRSSIIPSFLINKTIKVYNGKEFKPLLITEDKIGFKFGEFIFTRKAYIYKGKKKIIKKK